VSRKGCKAAPGVQHNYKYCWGCFAALSRHKAAPTIDPVHQPDEVNASKAGQTETYQVIIVNS